MYEICSGPSGLATLQRSRADGDQYGIDPLQNPHRHSSLSPISHERVKKYRHTRLSNREYHHVRTGIEDRPGADCILRIWSVRCCCIEGRRSGSQRTSEIGHHQQLCQSHRGSDMLAVSKLTGRPRKSSSATVGAASGKHLWSEARYLPAARAHSVSRKGGSGGNSLEAIRYALFPRNDFLDQGG